ncbi:hypothetical protein [Clostridium sp. B9]|uniref:hypothetical protein n=1 Tax=Clostridium sp. B9 TaxID=3423224 RepID=UPI003D2F49C0
MDNLEKDLLNLKNDNSEVPKSVLNKVNLAFDEIRKRNSKENSGGEEYNTKVLNENNDIKERLGDKEEEVNKLEGNVVSMVDERSNKENRTTRRKSNKRKYIGIAAGLSLVTLIGLSTPVRATINKLFFNNAGIESAINNNYIQEVTDQDIVTKDFDMSLSKVLVDSSNIILDFEIDVKDAKELLKLEEDNKMVYCDISLYAEDGTIISKDGESGLIGMSEFKADNIKAKEGKVNLNFRFASTSGEIPKMNKMKVEIGELVFRTSTDRILYKTNLDWDFTVDLDDKFKKTEDILYFHESESSNIIINEVKAVPTGLFMNLDYLVPGHYEAILQKMKIIDENGKEHKMYECSAETIEGGDRITGTFQGISSFDNVDKFTLEIENPDRKTIDRVKFFKAEN